jgi:hypothetical protein
MQPALAMYLPPALSAVTRSLENLVMSAVPPTTEVTHLTLADAASSSHPSRVNVFLYRITTDPTFRKQRTSRPTKTISPPLELRYLVTAYENPARAIGQSEAELLWTALNAFHAKPHLAVPALGRDVVVRIEGEDLGLADLAAIWQASGTGFRASLSYVVHLPELAPIALPPAASMDKVREARLDRLGSGGSQ